MLRLEGGGEGAGASWHLVSAGTKACTTARPSVELTRQPMSRSKSSTCDVTPHSVWVVPQESLQRMHLDTWASLLH